MALYIHILYIHILQDVSLLPAVSVKGGYCLVVGIGVVGIEVVGRRVMCGLICVNDKSMCLLYFSRCVL